MDIIIIFISASHTMFIKYFLIKVFEFEFEIWELGKSADFLTLLSDQHFF